MQKKAKKIENEKNKKVLYFIIGIIFFLQMVIPLIIISSSATEGVPKTVTFIDKNMCEAVYLEIQAMYSDIEISADVSSTMPSITFTQEDDILKIKELKLTNSSITDITGIGAFTELEVLYLNNNNIENIVNPINDENSILDLTKLTELSLGNNNIESLESIASCTNLTFLALNNNQITDITPLESLENLETLYLDENSELEDISALEGLSDLETLTINNTNVTNISAVQDIINLYTGNEFKIIHFADEKFCTYVATIHEPKHNDNNEKLMEKVLINAMIIKKENISKIKNITRINSRYYTDITDITGIENFTGLTDIDLNYMKVINISALSNLTNLTTLNLSNNQISDISALSSLTNLTTLYLASNNITDISALSSLTNLTNLSLNNNQIADISALSSLTNLTTLGLNNNQITDISALSNLTNLTTLELQNNQRSDISSLSSLTNLKDLHLENNQISDISSLSSLTNLEYLHLENNQISDISSLSTLTNLKQLYLEGNQINLQQDTNETTNINLTGLINLNIIDLSNCQISDEDVEILVNILPNVNRVTLDLANNQITNIEPFSVLSNLYTLNLSYNNIFEFSSLENFNIGNINITNQTKTFEYEEPITYKNEILVDIPELFKTVMNKNNFIYTRNAKIILSGDLYSSLGDYTNYITEDLAKMKLITNCEGDASQKVYIAGGLLSGTEYIVNYNVIPTYTDVTFEDENMCNAIESNLSQINIDGVGQTNAISSKNGNTLTIKYINEIKSLYLNNKSIINISGLENFTNLIYLNLPNNQIIDISKLEHLTNLIDLDLSQNKIETISGLENLIDLQSLTLSDNKIVDISSLKNLTKLESLNVSENKIVNISCLENLINLEYLDLYYNKIVDISSLKNLNNLGFLDIGHNQIEKIDVLENITTLGTIFLNNNKIKNISCLSSLTNLEELDLENNSIESFEVLNSLSNLKTVSIGRQNIKVSPGETGVVEQFSEAYCDLPNVVNEIVSQGKFMYLPNAEIEPFNPDDSNNGEIIKGETVQAKLKTSMTDGNYINRVRASGTIPKADKFEEDITFEIRITINYSINAMIEDATFTDVNLYKMLLNKLPSQNIIDTNDNTKTIRIKNKFNITNINLDFTDNPEGIEKIEDISGIDFFANLTSLSLKNNNLSSENSNLAILENLENLNSLYLSKNNISNVSGLSNLEDLTSLDLSNNQIKNIEPLSTLTNLRTLVIDNNQIEDVSILNNMANLNSINIKYQKITILYNTDITYKTENIIQDLPEIIKQATIYNNSLFSELEYGNCEPTSDKKIKLNTNYAGEHTAYVRVINGPLQETEYKLIYNVIPTYTDVTFEDEKMCNKVETFLQNENFNSIPGITENTNLIESRNGNTLKIKYIDEISTLYLSGNQNEKIEKINGIENFKNLTYLNIENNEIVDITPILSLTNLTSLNMLRNKIKDISVLTSLINLESLDVSNNCIEDINFHSVKPLSIFSFTGQEIDLDIGNIYFYENEYILIDAPKIFTQLQDPTNRIYNENVIISGAEFENGKLGINVTNNLGINTREIRAINGDGTIAIRANITFNAYRDEKEVKFEDVNLYNAIKDNLTNYNNTGKNLIISQDDNNMTLKIGGIENLIKTLNLKQSNISNLSGLENFSILENLNLSGKNITDISYLSSLTNLTDLDLSNNNISDISVLPNFTKLKNLDLSNNHIINFSIITSLEGLLNLKNQTVNENLNIQVTQGEYYNLQVSTHLNLEQFGPNGNSIVSSHFTCENVKYYDYLNVLLNTDEYGNQTARVIVNGGKADGTIYNMNYYVTPKVQQLYFEDENLYNALQEELADKIESANNKIININSENIDSVTNLNLENKNIENLSGIEAFRNLETLNISNNKISDVTPIEKLTKLTNKNNATNININNQTIAGNYDKTVIQNDTVLVDMPSIFKEMKNAQSKIFTQHPYVILGEENCQIIDNKISLNTSKYGQHTAKITVQKSGIKVASYELQYTVTPITQFAHFGDYNLYTYLKQNLEVISYDDEKQILELPKTYVLEKTSLDLSGAENIEKVEGLDVFINLQELNLSNQKIKDINDIKLLPSGVKYINLNNQTIDINIEDDIYVGDIIKIDEVPLLKQTEGIYASKQINSTLAEQQILLNTNLEGEKSAQLIITDNIYGGSDERIYRINGMTINITYTVQSTYTDVEVDNSNLYYKLKESLSSFYSGYTNLQFPNSNINLVDSSSDDNAQKLVIKNIQIIKELYLTNIDNPDSLGVCGNTNLNWIKDFTNLINLNLSGINVTSLKPIEELTKLEEVRISITSLDYSSLGTLNNLKRLYLSTKLTDNLSIKQGDNISFTIPKNFEDGLGKITNNGSIINENIITLDTEISGKKSINLQGEYPQPLDSMMKRIYISIPYYVEPTNKIITIRDEAFYNALMDNIIEYIDDNDYNNYEYSVNKLENGYYELTLPTDILYIENLELANYNLTNIEDIAYFTNLKYVDLSYNNINNISYLANLNKLEELNLNNNNKLENISYISGLTNLKELNLENTKVSDLSVLSNKNNLKSLNIKNTLVVDIFATENLNNIYELNVSGTGITNLEFLKDNSQIYYKIDLSNNGITDSTDLTWLQQLNDVEATGYIELNLSNNNLSNMDKVQYLSKLENLNLSGNNLTQIGDLERFNKLERLNLNNNQIEDITNINTLNGVSETRYDFELKLSNNQITDISSLESLKTFSQQKCLKLNLSNNNITNIDVLIGEEGLSPYLLDLGNNQIEKDEAQASKIRQLNVSKIRNLFLENTNITDDDLSMLENIEELCMLNLNNNNLQDVSAIKNITNLEELEYLGLSGNNIDLSTLPMLSYVEYLDLSNNNLESLENMPSESLAQIINLNLSNNNLTNLQGLSNTIILLLNVSNNNLTSLEGTGAIFAIKANNNKITSTSQLEDIANISYLDLSYNTLEEIDIYNKINYIDDKNKQKDLNKFLEIHNMVYKNHLDDEDDKSLIEELEVVGNSLGTLMKLGELSYVYTNNQTITYNYPTDITYNTLINDITMPETFTQAEAFDELEFTYENCKKTSDGKIELYTTCEGEKAATITATNGRIAGTKYLINYKVIPTYKEVTFEDENMCNAVENYLSLNYMDNPQEGVEGSSLIQARNENTLTIKYIDSIKQLILNDSQINNISGIEEFTNLTTLNLSNNHIEDISYIKTLTNLTTLELSNNKIKDIQVISSLIKLDNLYLSNNVIEDATFNSVKPLTNFTIFGQTISVDLGDIYLYGQESIKIDAPKIFMQTFDSNHRVYDTSATISGAEFENGKLDIGSFTLGTFNNQVFIRGGQYTYDTMLDITYHVYREEKEVTFEDVNLYNAIIKDLSNYENTGENLIVPGDYGPNTLKIAGIDKVIKKLDLAQSNITNLSGLENFTQVEHLDLRQNNISDITCLANLNKLSNLDLSSNHIIDISALDQLNLTGIFNLRNQEINVTIDIDATQQQDALIDIPEDIIQFTNENSKIYSSNGFTLEKAQMTQDNKILLNTDNYAEQTSSIVINSGNATGTRYNMTYNVKAKLENLHFEDTNLYNSLKEELSDIIKDSNDEEKILSINLDDIDSVITLNLEGKNIENISGIEVFKNLTTLNVSNNKIGDISPIEKLEKIENINIKYQTLTGNYDGAVIEKSTVLVDMPKIFTQSKNTQSKVFTPNTDYEIISKEKCQISQDNKIILDASKYGEFTAKIAIVHNEEEIVSYNLTYKTISILQTIHLEDIKVYEYLRDNLEQVESYNDEKHTIELPKTYVEELSSLDLSNAQGIQSVEGLNVFINLQNLDLRNQKIKDINNIGTLPASIQNVYLNNQTIDIALEDTIYVGEQKEVELPELFKQALNAQNFIYDSGAYYESQQQSRMTQENKVLLNTDEEGQNLIATVILKSTNEESKISQTTVNITYNVISTYDDIVVDNENLYSSLKETLSDFSLENINLLFADDSNTSNVNLIDEENSNDETHTLRVKNIKTINNLKIQNVSSTGTTNLEWIEKFTGLVKFEMPSFAITTLQPLSTLNNLEKLNITTTQLDYECLDNLNKLTDLSIETNDLSVSQDDKITFTIPKSFEDGITYITDSMNSSSINGKVVTFDTQFSGNKYINLSGTYITENIQKNINILISYNVAPTNKTVVIRDEVFYNALMRYIENEYNSIEYTTQKLSNNYYELTAPTDFFYTDELWLNGYDISNIEDITNFTKLKLLDLSYNKIANLYPLKELNTLEELYLNDNNELNNISHLENLNNLKELNLENTQVSDLSILNNKNNLRSLNVNNTNVTDISAIHNLNNIHTLKLAGTQITNLEFLIQNAKNFYKIDLSNNNITNETDLMWLQTLNNLETTNSLELNISDNNLSNMDKVKDLSKLEKLNLSGNQLNMLDNLIALNKLNNLDVSNNNITDINNIETLDKHSERGNGFHLNLSKNNIEDISKLESLSTFENESISIYLDLSNNNITNIDALEQTAVYLLDLGNNPIGSQIQKLNTSKITQLFLENTNITRDDLKILEDIERLYELDLSNNGLESVTPIKKVADLSQLKYLNLSKNNIDLSKLPTLDGATYVDLSENNLNSLQTIPEEGLGQIIYLNLSNNNLTNLNGLQKAYMLDVSNNKLSSLEGITEAFAIKANNNNLTTTTDLEKISNITYLDLSYNSLEEVDIYSRINYIIDETVQTNTNKYIELLCKTEKSAMLEENNSLFGQLDRIDKKMNKLTDAKELTYVYVDNQIYNINEETLAYGESREIELPKIFSQIRNSQDVTYAQNIETEKCSLSNNYNNMILDADMPGEFIAKLKINSGILRGSRYNVTYDVKTPFETIGFIPPEKQLYKVGEPLDLTGGRFKLTYADKSFEYVSIYPNMVEGFDSSKGGEKTLIISYLNFKYNFKITVQKELIDVELIAPEKRNYIIGDSLDLTGGKLREIYDDNTEEVVVLTLNMIRPFDMEVLGEKILTVDYKGYERSFKITVRDVPPVIDSNKYIVGEDKIIKLISPETTVDKFLSNITTNAKKVEIYDGSRKLENTDIIATEMKLKADGQDYYLIVMGDLNRDGYANEMDAYLMMYMAIFKKNIFDDLLSLINSEFIASDINQDNTVNEIDTLLMLYNNVKLDGYILSQR